jgi:4-hydroxybenzoate polyprenyltransferase
MIGSAYWRLMRLDKPIGILLLWYPTAWGLWFSNKGLPPLKLMILFLIGTILMRSAGCVINDIADRHIDKQVNRTKLRPLTAGEVSLRDAFLLLLLLLLGSLFILFYLPPSCFVWALLALLITFIYPFCKRYISAPQMILGLAFSMGIPMVYVASGSFFNEEMGLLFLINFFWIIAYDTMYAMVDKEDDLKIGVKSTAIYFAQYDKLVIGLLLLIMHALWFYWAACSHATWGFYFFWVSAGVVLLYQQKLINEGVPSQCFRSFLFSAYYGLLMWLALIVAFL